jgi:hypothetical protein
MLLKFLLLKRNLKKIKTTFSSFQRIILNENKNKKWYQVNYIQKKKFKFNFLIKNNFFFK